MLKASILILAISIFAGCTSSSDSDSLLVYVESVNLKATNEYDLITCKYNTSKIRIVVNRLSYSDCKTIIREGTFYKFHLQKIDSVVHATTNIIPSRGAGIIIEDSSGDPYFENNMLVGNLYSSPDLNGICIINPNIFHYP